MMHMLLQAHQEFQIVIPRTLANFTGQVLILPDVKCVSAAEISALQNFNQKGGKLFVTGQGGAFDETGKGRLDNPLLSMLNVNDISKRRAADGGYIYDPAMLGTAYLETVRQGFDSTAWTGTSNDKLEKMRNEFLSDLTNVLKFKPAIQMTASPYMTAQPALVNGKIHIFMANYKGLKGREVVK